ncbi:hypothetical protein LAG90_02655 [Marinilongibacter aquaticus]|uniref:hypothetical protein n=1 Tax=Marinilongibacter aquaticus TaxID=2975157 RepID=UPI0021BDDCA8|nr:hypothetical protein [Marinilongibacter aquaticus]UBM59555.1 hypothetical protein LAG90_02655 [Marinilongibacter aquaticus]
MEEKAKKIAEEVIRRKTRPIDGLEEMQNILRQTKYSERYIQFLNLEEDLNFLKYSSIAIGADFLESNTIDELITKEFECFLAFEKIVYEEGFEGKVFCAHCQNVGQTNTRKKLKFQLPPIQKVEVCSTCRSEKIHDLSTKQGQKKLAKSLKYSR